MQLRVAGPLAYFLRSMRVDFLVRIGLTVSLWTLLSSCDTNASKQFDTPSRSPTATEMFHLRSECGVLGRKLLKDNPVDWPLSAVQISHYNQKTNRCYVEIDVHKANLLESSQAYFQQTLYDGQTGNTLAWALTLNGLRSARIFDLTLAAAIFSSVGNGVSYDESSSQDAILMMSLVMADDQP